MFKLGGVVLAIRGGVTPAYVFMDIKRPNSNFSRGHDSSFFVYFYLIQQ